MGAAIFPVSHFGGMVCGMRWCGLSTEADMNRDSDLKSQVTALMRVAVRDTMLDPHPRVIGWKSRKLKKEKLLPHDFAYKRVIVLMVMNF